ncbi:MULTISPECIES: sodium:solute symporter family protein [unclassified Halomonas]|uniref:Sodium:solute symporter family protein n=1 Tax=Halomonas sp. RT37 TaxID=2950872 RepID=A0AAU7KJB5_9GAMM|nr:MULTISPECIES: sodium:solute symporter family protein [unclassified Halomonas]MBS8270751.1 sodium:solute symporter family protein [Halomonas litopenaei]MCO7214085.1 sodium:solute symporter family protein [Halomonas sp. OfavH-34-E]USZ50257.1 sodium:solute symporter family protein [Halomonas sp. DN3]
MSDSLLITAMTVGYLVIVLLVGLRARRGQGSSLEGYVAGGRHMGLLVLFFILGAEIFSAFAFLGAPGWAYSKGAPAFYIIAYLTLAVIVWWLIAPHISRLGRRHGFLTQAEFLSACYPTPKNVLGLVIGVVSVLAMIPYLTIQIAGAGMLFEAATSGTIPFWLGSLLACGVVAAYVYASGLQGIGWTNLMQGLMMVVIAWALGLTTAEQFFGGVGEMFQQIKDQAPEYLTMPGATGMGWGAFSTAVLVSALGCVMWPHIFMKFYSAKDVRTLKRVFVLYPLYSYLLVPLLIIGFAGIVLLADTPLDSPDRVLLTIVVELADLPAWVIGLALSGALAAAMSTAANLAHTSATILVRDVVQFTPRMRALPEHKALSLTRYGVIAISLMAYLLALANPGSLVSLLLGAYGIIVQLLPMLLGALFWRRASQTAAFIGLSVGAVITLLLQFGIDAPFGWHPGFCGLVVNSAIFVVISLMRKSRESRSPVECLSPQV